MNMPTTIRMAKVFDGADDGVPYYLPDHPRLNPAERTEVLAYLSAGTALMTTTATEPDFIDAARGEVVPINFRTDGSWIWNDALAYYVDAYGYAPEPDFLTAMRDAGWACPAPDDEAVKRALEELFEDDEDE